MTTDQQIIRQLSREAGHNRTAAKLAMAPELYAGFVQLVEYRIRAIYDANAALSDDQLGELVELLEGFDWKSVDSVALDVAIAVDDLTSDGD